MAKPKKTRTYPPYRDEHITGAYVRAEREGRMLSLDIACLNDTELASFFLDCDTQSARNWAVFLAAWIRDHVQPEPSK